MKKNTIHISAGMCAALVGASMCLPILSQTAPVKLDPKKMPAIGKVDDRFQSYNIEMLEVAGGDFRALYKPHDNPPADPQQATPGGMPASLYRYRAPINL